MPRRQDDRRPHSGGRRIPVDPRGPGFDARSILVQGLVDGNRLTEKVTTEMHLPAAEDMFRGQSVLVEPSGLL